MNTTKLTAGEILAEYLADFAGLCKTADYLPVGKYAAEEYTLTPDGVEQPSGVMAELSFHDHPHLSVRISVDGDERTFTLTETIYAPWPHDGVDSDHEEEFSTMYAMFQALAGKIVRGACDAFYEAKTLALMNGWEEDQQRRQDAEGLIAEAKYEQSQM